MSLALVPPFGSTIISSSAGFQFSNIQFMEGGGEDGGADEGRKAKEAGEGGATIHLLRNPRRIFLWISLEIIRLLRQT